MKIFLSSPAAKVQNKNPFGLEECNMCFRNGRVVSGRDIASKTHWVNVTRAHSKKVLNISNTKKLYIFQINMEAYSILWENWGIYDRKTLFYNKEILVFFTNSATGS